MFDATDMWIECCLPKAISIYLGCVVIKNDSDPEVNSVTVRSVHSKPAFNSV